MPEYEPRPGAVPAFVPSARRSSDDDAEFDFLADTDEELRPQREGLPPEYRMRADPHYVEQLTARAPVPQVRAIPIADIHCARHARPGDLDALVRSIAAHGVLQPLLVRGRTGRLEVIAGARRLAAATRAGLSHVPCIVQACDDAGARALEEAAAVGGSSDAVLPDATHVPLAAVEELGQSVAALQSCLPLLADSQTSLRERVALDLLRAEAHRATRLVQALTFLSQKPTLNVAPAAVDALLREALEAFEPERRLSAASISVEIAGGPYAVLVDGASLGAAFAGAIGGMLALEQHRRTPALEVRVSQGAEGFVRVEIAQQSASVDAAALARFFDTHWTERPGGYRAAVGLAAARRVLEWHGGSIEIRSLEAGGCRLGFTIPSATRPR